MRISEFVGLIISDIEFENHRIKVEPMIGGYVGFLCLDKNEMPMVALHWEKYFQHIREKYNSIYKVQMPCVPPHVCWHTYCSKMAKTGMNPKTLQYIMGHADVLHLILIAIFSLMMP